MANLSVAALALVGAIATAGASVGVVSLIKGNQNKKAIDTQIKSVDTKITGFKGELGNKKGFEKDLELQKATFELQEAKKNLSTVEKAVERMKGVTKFADDVLATAGAGGNVAIDADQYPFLALGAARFGINAGAGNGIQNQDHLYELCLDAVKNPGVGKRGNQPFAARNLWGALNNVAALGGAADPAHVANYKVAVNTKADEKLAAAQKVVDDAQAKVDALIK